MEDGFGLYGMRYLGVSEGRHDSTHSSQVAWHSCVNR
jgi:hypothetical protein